LQQWIGLVDVAEKLRVTIMFTDDGKGFVRFGGALPLVAEAQKRWDAK
jgi:hypothetical protein